MQLTQYSECRVCEILRMPRTFRRTWFHRQENHTNKLNIVLNCVLLKQHSNIHLMHINAHRHTTVSAAKPNHWHFNRGFVASNLQFEHFTPILWVANKRTTYQRLHYFSKSKWCFRETLHNWFIEKFTVCAHSDTSHWRDFPTIFICALPTNNIIKYLTDVSLQVLTAQFCIRIKSHLSYELHLVSENRVFFKFSFVHFHISITSNDFYSYFVRLGALVYRILCLWVDCKVHEYSKLNLENLARHWLELFPMENGNWRSIFIRFAKSRIRWEVLVQFYEEGKPHRKFLFLFHHFLSTFEPRRKNYPQFDFHSQCSPSQSVVNNYECIKIAPPRNEQQ